MSAAPDPFAHEMPPRVGRLVLLGHPVAHSLSPTFQNAALDAAGRALRYEALDVAPADLDRTLGALRAACGAGNVTVPHKGAVRAACDAVTPVARAVGAVNTFWTRADGTLVGDNTDVAGAEVALRSVARATPGRVALLGAGGAAAAVVAAAAHAWPGARVAIWSRRPEAAAALADRFAHAETHAVIEHAVTDADVVVNATSLGLRLDDPLPCSIGVLPADAAVLDLVYGVHETAWVRAACTAGHVAQDGLLMLVEQGAAAFARWFGVEPDRARMWDAVEQRAGRGRPEPVL